VVGNQEATFLKDSFRMRRNSGAIHNPSQALTDLTDVLTDPAHGGV
jgi:hypothetical protein